MKKRKIYIDTSIISHLQQDDAPEKTKTTLQLWQEILSDKYDVYISEIITAELEDCPEPKRSILEFQTHST